MCILFMGQARDVVVTQMNVSHKHFSEMLYSILNVT